LDYYQRVNNWWQYPLSIIVVVVVHLNWHIYAYMLFSSDLTLWATNGMLNPSVPFTVYDFNKWVCSALLTVLVLN